MGQIKFQFGTCEVGKLWGRTCLIPLGLVKLATELAGLAAMGVYFSRFAYTSPRIVKH